MSYYNKHVFFCTNLREDGRPCCQASGSLALRAYAKARCKELGIAHKGGVRINSAGCLDRCADGPVIVVYPEEVWYTYIDEADLDEIIDQHLVNGRIVERLRIKTDLG